MDATLVAATAAALGSIVGGSASIVATWVTQRGAARRATKESQYHERERLYQEFITEASRLVADALVHSLDRPDQVVALYGILSGIRLTSSNEVLGRAEECCRRIVKLYRQPNMTSDQIHAAYDANELDLLKDFSAACRTELRGFAQP
jgi:hypothetical protein